MVRARRDTDILWAMEEALRCRALGAVLGEIGQIHMVASRRLQLAAEQSGVTGLLLRAADRRLGATASVTRWGLSAAPSRPPNGEPGGDPGLLGVLRWRTRLLRCRGGQPGEWLLEWHGSGFTLVEEAMAEDTMADQEEAEPEWLQRILPASGRGPPCPGACPSPCPFRQPRASPRHRR